jgi:hypothetical protein
VSRSELGLCLKLAGETFKRCLGLSDGFLSQITRGVAVGDVPLRVRNVRGPQSERDEVLPPLAMYNLHLNANLVVTRQGRNIRERSPEFNEHLLGASTRDREYRWEGPTVISWRELRACRCPRYRRLPA